jgi:hypothetical protein
MQTPNLEDLTLDELAHRIQQSRLAFVKTIQADFQFRPPSLSPEIPDLSSRETPQAEPLAVK